MAHTQRARIIALKAVGNYTTIPCACGAPLVAGYAYIRIIDDRPQQLFLVYAEKTTLACALCGKVTEDTMPVLFDSFRDAFLKAASLKRGIEKGELIVKMRVMDIRNNTEMRH